MAYGYHSGEIEIQRKLGVEQPASKLAVLIHDVVSERAKGFIVATRFALINTSNSQGQSHSTILRYPEKSITFKGNKKVHIDTNYSHLDIQTHANITTTGKLATLFMDFQTGRRVRVNSDNAKFENHLLTFDVRECYPNCGKYIDRHYQVGSHSGTVEHSTHSVVGDSQWEALLKSNTVFLGSMNKNALPDISHRGNLKDIILRDGDCDIILPNYSGNNMFNTIGNLLVTPYVSLLVFDAHTHTELCFTGPVNIEENIPTPYKDKLELIATHNINLYLRISVEQCTEKVLSV